MKLGGHHFCWKEDIEFLDVKCKIFLLLCQFIHDLLTILYLILENGLASDPDMILLMSM